MNKVYKVLSVLSICCLSLLIAPFHISANTSLSAPFVGLNVYQWDVEHNTYVANEYVDLDFGGASLTCNSVNSSGVCSIYAQNSNKGEITGRISNSASTSTYYMYRYDLILDDDYVGSVTINSKTYYVNGNILSFIISGAEQTITINSYSLSRKSDGITWMFPIESFSVVSFALKNLELSGITQYDNYEYPIFSVKTGDTLFQTYLQPGQTFEMIFYASFLAPNDTQMLQRIDFGGLTLDYIEPIALVINNNQGSGRFYRVVVSGGNSDNYNITSKRYFDFMPIFGARNDDAIRKYLSTDFALRWGLSNSLLNDLNIIANGTSSSASSQSDLSQKTDNLTQSSNELVTHEDAFNNDMNNALQDINTDFDFGSAFGSKFIASADFVKTQFDRLTGNTPFGSVISFSLLIGLALLLVGKVFK